ncbi:MAG: SPOR domain-containing protein [Desulfobacterales bacterium]|jgi:Flp pilus assembly protein TadD
MRSIKTVLAILGTALLLMHSAARAQDEDWHDRGLRLLGEQQYDEAIKAFSTAIEIIPLDYQSYNYRGVARALQGDFDRAIADYSKAIEIRPRNAKAFNNRGFAHTQTGNLKAALHDYTRALEINPFFVDAYNNKAWILATSSDRRIRDGEQAVSLATKAVELKSDISSVDTLAAAHAATGNFKTAVDLQTKAIQQLMLENKTAEVPKYMRHLRHYRSRQALLIDYSVRPQKAVAQTTPKTSLKARTKKALAATDQKANMTAASNLPKPDAVKSLPYTIQVSSFRKLQKSTQVARKLNTKGDPAFISPVDIGGKGKWYRVYIGNYKTLAEAKTAANDLKRRKFRYVNVTRKPYAVQIGEPIPQSRARELQSQLQAKGYFSYLLLGSKDPDRIRVLIGAFEDKKAATGLVRQLSADGFNPTIALR